MTAVNAREITILRFLAASILAATLTFTAASRAVESETTAVPDAWPAAQKLVRDGVSIEFRAFPEEGQDAVTEGRFANVEFRITDAESGNPISGIYPAVWLDIAKPWEKYDLKLQSWAENQVRRADRWAQAHAIVAGERSVDREIDAGFRVPLHEATLRSSSGLVPLLVHPWTGESRG